MDYREWYNTPKGPVHPIELEEFPWSRTLCPRGEVLMPEGLCHIIQNRVRDALLRHSEDIEKETQRVLYLITEDAYGEDFTGYDWYRLTYDDDYLEEVIKKDGDFRHKPPVWAPREIEPWEK